MFGNFIGSFNKWHLCCNTLESVGPNRSESSRCPSTHIPPIWPVAAKFTSCTSRHTTVGTRFSPANEAARFCNTIMSLLAALRRVLRLQPKVQITVAESFFFFFAASRWTGESGGLARSAVELINPKSRISQMLLTQMMCSGKL